MKLQRCIAVPLVGLVLAACGTDADPKCATNVTFDPPPGTFPEASETLISITQDQGDARIYFTLDKTRPVRGQANTFEFSLPLTGVPVAYNGMPIRYFYESCGNVSGEDSAVYFLDGPAKSTIDPPPGLYNRAITVTIVANEPADIVYTLDGSEPDVDNPSAQRVSAPVQDLGILSSTTVKFASVDALGNLEDAQVANYIIDTIPPQVSITPNPGASYDDSVEVEIRITNDAGKIWYTTNGGVPVENDPTGDTLQASGTLTVTFTQSTVLRYLAVDKVGNRESDLPEAGYKEVVYYIDCKPAAVAVPPGGAYADTELSVELIGYPPGGTVKYTRDEDPTVYNYSTPIELTGVPSASLTFWNQASMALVNGCAGTQTGDPVTADYVLGTEIPQYNYEEDFTTDTYIDANATTAEVDLADGVIVLPFHAPELTIKRENNTLQTGATVLLSRTVHSIWPGLSSYAFVLEGPVRIFQGATGHQNDANLSGLKVFSHTNMFSGSGSPTLTYESTWVPLDYGTLGQNGQPTDLAVLEAADGTPMAAIGRIQGIEFVDLTDVDSLEAATATITFGAPAATTLLLSKPIVGFSSYLYAVVNGAGDADVYAYEVSDAEDVSQVDSLALDANVVDWVLLDEDPNDGGIDYTDAVLLMADCRIKIVRLSALGNISEQATFSGICDSANDTPVRVTSFRGVLGTGIGYDSSTYYVFASYNKAGADGQVAMLRLVSGAASLTLSSAVAENLDATIGGISVVQVPGTGEHVLAVSAAGLVQLYDLSSTEVPIASMTGAQRLPRLGRVSLGTNALGYDMVSLNSGYFLSTHAVAPPASTKGGLAALRVPTNARERVSSAVAQSSNINPSSGRAITSVQFIDATNSANVGTIDYEVKIGTAAFAPFVPGQVIAVSDGSDTVVWRATLGISLTDETPELDNLHIRLTYEE